MMARMARQPVWRRLTVLISLALLLCVALQRSGWIGQDTAPAEAAPNAAEGRTFELKYPRVIDGHTLDGYIDGRRIAVAYRGVETPQRNERCGQEALADNRQLAGQKVVLQEGPEGPKLDSYGRWLYYAYTPDGRSIDEALLRNGTARARSDGRYAQFLQSAESQARASRSGCLWR